MKLKCNTHDKRVVVFADGKGLPVTMHRNGLGERCGDESLVLGTTFPTTWQVLSGEHQSLGRTR